MLYSKTTGGFYDADLHADIPDDAVAVSDEDYRALLNGQDGGRFITAGADGNPVLVDAPVRTQGEISALRIAEIDQQLSAIDMKKVRALTDFALSGDASRLVELEAEAIQLRGERRGLVS